MSGALDGLRVLDVATLFPGPLLAAMLGDLGADVIKLEPPGGDTLRELGVRVDGRSLTWAAVGRNKRGITLDLGQERGQALFRRLVERSDVLIENFPPATAARFHCTYEELRQLNPRLVVASVSCYGRSGPYRDRAGNGTLAEAYAGLTHMTGERDGPPMLTSLPIGDVLGAVQGVIGVLAACYHRDARGGRGQHVDVSMYEPILQFLLNGVLRYGRTGEAERRSGSRIPGAVPRNTYRTRDGQWVALSAVTDRMIARLLGAMDRASAENLRHFGRQPERSRHEEELDREVAHWIARHDRDHVVQTLAAAQIPISPVNDVAALFADPHIAARGNLVQVVDPGLGPLRLLAPTPRLSETPGSVRSTGPALGQHNAEVYGQLGLGSEELEELRRAGVI
jgi:formyl-CoA transferase